MENILSEKEIEKVHNKSEYEPMHTAEHILNRTMVNMFGCGRSVENHIERTKSKCNYILDIEPTKEQIEEVERKVNEVIEQDLEVTWKDIPLSELKEDVSSLPKTVQELGFVRMVYVGVYDECRCVGSHVSHTKQIGKFRISSYTYKEGRLRIVFRLSDSDSIYN